MLFVVIISTKIKPGFAEVPMKRIKVLMIYIFLPLVICLGCNKKEKADNSFDVPQSTDSVLSMLNIEPITIPKEESTLDTI